MTIAPVDIRRGNSDRYPAGPSFLPRLLSGRILSQNTASYLLNSANDYGDFIHHRIAGRHAYQLNHPDLIQDYYLRDAAKHNRGVVMQRARDVLGEGMLTSEEPLHMRQRRLAQPAFHRTRIAAYGDVIANNAAAMTARWENGATLDLHHEMLELALRIVGKCLFDIDVQSEVKKIAAAVDAFMEFLPLALLPFATQIQKLPLPVMKRIRRGEAELDALIYSMIRERRLSPGDRGDLLSMLLAAVDTEENTGAMTDKQVRDECLTVMLAGHETTANALSFALWLLAQNPAIQQNLHRECRAVLGDRRPTATDYPELRYAEMVFAEAMRLYPPVWVNARTCATEYEIAGYRIPRGAIILAPQIAVHNDARFWPDPARFDPLRFTDEAKAARPRFAYFPFGAGSRQCIGEGLAWMEGVLVLAAIVKDWRIFPLPTSSTTLEVTPAITLRPKHGLPLIVERRPVS